MEGYTEEVRLGSLGSAIYQLHGGCPVVHIEPSKVQVVHAWPKSVTEIRKFEWLTSFYRKFVSGMYQL